MAVARTSAAFAACALACAGCAHSIGQSATRGAAETIQTKISKVDTEAALAVARRTAAAAAEGALSELSAHTHVFDAVATTAATAAARGFLDGMRAADAEVLALVDRASAHMVAGVGRALANDEAFRASVVSLAGDMSASATVRARDEIATVFPACAGADRQRCIEDYIANLSRAAARGLTSGLAAPVKLAVLALAFLSGVLLTLLVVRGRRPVIALPHEPAHHAH
jgi:hypothetical protein